MHNERVVLGDGGAGRMVRQARSIVIHDVRPLALCLSGIESDVILWSHQTAVEVLDKIVRRQRHNYVREVFEIDVPDLHNFAQQFPREEQTLLLSFWTLYDALVRHFMPRATARAYYYDGGRRGGLRYYSPAWYSPEPKK